MTSPASHNPTPSWNPVNRKLAVNGSMGISLVALAITGLFLLSGLATLAMSTFGRGTGRSEPAVEIKNLVAKHDHAMKTWQDRFNGRSVFFKPPAPVKKPVYVAPAENVPPPPPPPPPGPDPVYRGPSISFAYGDTVYFSPLVVTEKFLRVKVGEENSGVRVISCNLPWSVKVGYKGGEYDVPLFAKTEESLFVSATPRQMMLSSFLVAVPPSGALPAAVSDAGSAAHLAGENSLPANVGQPDERPRRRQPREERGAKPAGGAEVPAVDENVEDEVIEEDMDDPAIDDDAVPDEAGEEVDPPDEEEIEEPVVEEVPPVVEEDPPVVTPAAPIAPRNAAFEAT